jgi:hypothetical protein
MSHLVVQCAEKFLTCMMMMMSFVCSCRNKIGAELHIHLEEVTYHKRLFRGPIEC